MSKEARVRALIAAWEAYRAPLTGSALFCQLKGDLYMVRNPGYQGLPPLSSWPAPLLDADPEVVAAVEHYFLCRCWVGTGYQPAWQLRAESWVYDKGKQLHATPRSNPNNAPTPPSELQRKFQEEGIRDGEADLKAAGKKAPWIAKPPTYFKT